MSAPSTMVLESFIATLYNFQDATHLKGVSIIGRILLRLKNEAQFFRPVLHFLFISRVMNLMLFNYSCSFFFNASAISNSSSCFSSTTFGASVIKQDASLILGNAITSLILSSFAISIIKRSKP